MSQTKCNDVHPVVIFYPNNELIDSGYLCGEVVNDELLKTKNFFVHKVIGNLNSESLNVIGVVGKILQSKNKKFKYNWLKIKIQDAVPIIKEVVSNQHLVPHRDCHLIIYNKPYFIRSELLLESHSEVSQNSNSEVVDDHFKRLVCSLKKMTPKSHDEDKRKAFVLKILLVTLTAFFTGLDTVLSRLTFVLKLSTLVSHMSAFVKRATLELQAVQNRKDGSSLKTGNYVLGILADWVGGLLMIYWLLSYVSISDMVRELPAQSKIVVEALKDMVHYLMGSPADLKLNGPLNNVLGRFFLFHIDLWWAFLGFSRPLLEFGFRMFICLGSLGLSFQLAILADILTLASLHVYVIYVYAARLYNAQVTGLASLSRVFLGRKRNPLPGRVDSCPYSTEQLLIGTIAFTVLLFLLPTTLVYYVVFTAIRVMLVCIEGILSRARFILRAVPFYTSILWLLNSPITTSCVCLSPSMSAEGDQLVLVVTPVQRPWWPTLRSCMPPPPSPVPWTNLCWHLLTGQLIYPV